MRSWSRGLVVLGEETNDGSSGRTSLSSSAIGPAIKWNVLYY